MIFHVEVYGKEILFINFIIFLLLKKMIHSLFPLHQDGKSSRSRRVHRCAYHPLELASRVDCRHDRIERTESKKILRADGIETREWNRCTNIVNVVTESVGVDFSNGKQDRHSTNFNKRKRILTVTKSSPRTMVGVSGVRFTTRLSLCQQHRLRMGPRCQREHNHHRCVAGSIVSPIWCQSSRAITVLTPIDSAPHKEFSLANRSWVGSRERRWLSVHHHGDPGNRGLWNAKIVAPWTNRDIDWQKRARHNDRKIHTTAKKDSRSTPSATNNNNQKPIGTIPTTVALDSRWRSMTEELLELPVGSFNHGRWNESITVLTHWFGKNHRDDNFRSGGDNSQCSAIEQCWKILDRLCLELEESSGDNSNEKIDPRPVPTLSAIDVLNPILLLWRDEFLEQHRNRITDSGRSEGNGDHKRSSTPDGHHRSLFPSQVAELLRRYQRSNLVAMDTATHAILLDTAGKYSAICSRGTAGGERINEETQKQLMLQIEDDGDCYGNHEQGILFADRYLTEWIEDYRRMHTQFNNSDNRTNNSSIAPRTSNKLHERRIPPRPDVVVFGTIVHAWVESGLPGATRKAEAWVKTLDDLEETHPHKLSSTNEKECRRKLYTSVLLAWARAGNPSNAKNWMDRMIREEEYPDVQAFNCLLMAYQSAASGTSDINYANRAEDVLRHMQKLFHEPRGFLLQPPNVVSYNLVIDAWTKQAGIDASFRSSKSKDRAINAAKRAHGWMEQMKESGIHPNTITYNTVITAYSRAGLPYESEKLLQEMILIYRNEDDSNTNDLSRNPYSKQYETADATLLDKYVSMTTTKPDVQSFTAVLTGWARVGTLDAAKRADELLRVMQLPEVGIKPNVETYGSCINCWARVVEGTHARGNQSKRERIIIRDQREQAVRRAEELYHEMTEDRKIRPDVYAYTGLLNVYGRSGRSRKAHRFLEACLNEYDRTGDPRMKPTVVTFTAILNAWSKASNAPEAPEIAHELLNRMKNEYGIEPNAFSYSSVLDAYGRSEHPDAASNALSLFRTMRDVEGLEPNGYTCSNVLKAMARGGKVEDAEDLLRDLIRDASVKIKLGPHAFSSVLYGWSKSRRRDAPERAEALLADMEELYQQGRIDGPPNEVCWNNVLACWAANPELPGAAHRAEDLLRRIQRQQEEHDRELPGGRPDRPRGNGGVRYRSPVRCNRIMYNTVINAWANNGNLARASDLFDEFLANCVSDRNLSPPDEWTYRALWKAIVKTDQIGGKEKLHRLLAVMESMKDVGIQLNKNMKADLRRFCSYAGNGASLDDETTKQTQKEFETKMGKIRQEPKQRIDFSTLTVVQLREECRKRGLKVVGRKAELINRIKFSLDGGD